MKPIRRHLSYANVVATLALVFAMSGGALAAKHYLVNSTSQINPKVLKKLKGATGRTGPSGSSGPAGAQGSAGVQGGSGHDGNPGTALAYARVTKGATLLTADTSGVVDVKREEGVPKGIYCLYGSFKAHVASALVTHDESGGRETVAEVGLGPEASGCPPSGTGAPAAAKVLIRDFTSAISELENAGFVITFN